MRLVYTGDYPLYVPYLGREFQPGDSLPIPDEISLTTARLLAHSSNFKIIKEDTEDEK